MQFSHTIGWGLRARRLGWASLCSLLLACGALAQNPPAQPQSSESPRPKIKRIWTEDDLTPLRKPWELYLIEKEKKAEEERAARTAAEAAKKAAAKVKTQKPSATPAVGEEEAQAPETVRGLERRIADLQDKVDELEIKFQKAEQTFYESREDERDAATQAREAAASELESAHAELNLLEEKLRALKSAQTAPSS